MGHIFANYALYTCFFVKWFEIAIISQENNQKNIVCVALAVWVVRYL